MLSHFLNRHLAWSLQGEECAAAGARSAEAFAAAERVVSRTARAGWVQGEGSRDGYSAVSQRAGHCAPVAQLDDSSGDESRQADCSAGYSLALWADHSSPAVVWHRLIRLLRRRTICSPGTWGSQGSRTPDLDAAGCT
jgi:hypothetical protein